MFNADVFMARLRGPSLLMGILNVTPDSFSDGGQFYGPESAIRHARDMTASGADILDIGGESTRPGHTPISIETEQARVLPVIKAIATANTVPISIDTYNAATAKAALAAGADIVNDVWGLQRDPNMAAVVAEARCPVILMHNRDSIDADIDIIADIKRFLDRSLEMAQKAGVQTSRIILDPGFGFGKSMEQSLSILARLDDLAALGFPLLIGLSRKGFIGKFSGDAAVDDRLAGTLTANMAAIAANAAAIIRVHDVKPHRQMLDFQAALSAARPV